MGESKVKKKRKRKNRSYSLEFKLDAVQRLLSGERTMIVCHLLEIRKSLLYYWLNRYRKQVLERMGLASQSVEQTESALEVAMSRVAELERKVGQQEMEVDFLRKAFERVRESRQSNNNTGGTASAK
jgi:transposase